MSGERLERAREIFAAAVAIEPPDRPAMLHRSCGSDIELRQMVEELLAIDSEPDGDSGVDGILDTGGAEWLAAAIAVERELGSDALPERIAGFRVIREIGRGGMGVVYEAEQDEPARRVAFKVIHPGMISRGLLRRFRQETRAMAQLRHPGIAQIYEAGASASGEGGSMRPYFVMELVEGPSLVRFVAAEGLDVAARLELVARVCDALHHAHQKGVVHRDLKPDNILVQSAAGQAADGTGTLSIGVQPKILDFGVARLVEEQDTNSLRTMAGQIVGTIPYLSPEQALGESSVADIRSDIYSVGVILYEVLSGKLPFDTADRTVRAAVRAVIETQPRRLGTVERSLRGDVEAIVHKAMEREPERRYQSAADLAADLRRYLRSEPIEARVPSTLYAVSKFVQRHRSLVGVGAASIVMLIAAVVVMSMLWVQAKRAENEAVWQRYRSAMSAAGFALSKGEIGIARQQMESVDPRFRGWEYRHFLSRLDQSIEVSQPAVPAPFLAVPTQQGGVDGLVLVNPDSTKPPVWIAGLEQAPGLLDPRLRLWYAAQSTRPTLRLEMPAEGFLAPNPTDGELVLRRLEGVFQPDDFINCPRVSANGHVLAMIRASESRSALVVLDLATEETRVFELDETAIRCELSPDGSIVAVATGFSSARPPRMLILDARSGTLISSVEEASGEAKSMLFSRDGSRLIATFQSGLLQAWNIETPVAVSTARMPHPGGGIEGLTFNADQTLIAGGTIDGIIRIFDAMTLENTVSLSGHEAEIHDVAFLPGDGGLVSAGRDGKVRRWKLGPPSEAPLVLRGHTHLVHALAIGETGGFVATGSWDRTVRLFNLNDGRELASAPTGTFVQAMALSPDERVIVTREFEGDVRLFDVPSMRQIALIERQERPLDQPLFDASSRRVLMSFDPATATATFWQMGDDSSGEWVTAPGEQASACIGPTINRELGLIAISRSRDRWFGAVLYDLRTGREVLAIPTRRTATESIAFSPDGRSVAAPDDSHQIQLYELPSGKNSGTFKGHSREVLALVFSPDGSRLFSADLTGTIIVWDTHSREEITQLRGHEEHVRRLIVSGDGKLLISGSRDGTARVWRSSTPR